MDEFLSRQDTEGSSDSESGDERDEVCWRIQTERAWRDAHAPEMLAVGRVLLPPTVLTEQKEVFRKLPAKRLLDMVVAPPPGYAFAEYKRLMDEIDSRKAAESANPEIAKQSQFAGIAN